MSGLMDNPPEEVDFYQVLVDQVSSIGVDDFENTDIALHPAVEEYLAWIADEPLTYACVGDMPAEVASGFRHLCRTLGKQGMSAASAAHAAIAQQSQMEAEMEQARLMRGW